VSIDKIVYTLSKSNCDTGIVHNTSAMTLTGFHSKQGARGHMSKFNNKIDKAERQTLQEACNLELQVMDELVQTIGDKLTRLPMCGFSEQIFTESDSPEYNILALI
jgi:hypothetical protein